MSSWVLFMMITVSLLLGAITLFALLWGLRTKQFDDENKFTNAVRFDSVDDLREAVKREERKKSMLKEQEK